MAGATAAIANAFFDATGVRLQKYPLTPKRVLSTPSRRNKEFVSTLLRWSFSHLIKNI